MRAQIETLESAFTQADKTLNNYLKEVERSLKDEIAGISLYYEKSEFGFSQHIKPAKDKLERLDEIDSIFSALSIGTYNEQISTLKQNLQDTVSKLETAYQQRKALLEQQTKDIGTLSGEIDNYFSNLTKLQTDIDITPVIQQENIETIYKYLGDVKDIKPKYNEWMKDDNLKPDIEAIRQQCDTLESKITSSMKDRITDLLKWIPSQEKNYQQDVLTIGTFNLFDTFIRQLNIRLAYVHKCEGLLNSEFYQKTLAELNEIKRKIDEKRANYPLLQKTRLNELGTDFEELQKQHSYVVSINIFNFITKNFGRVYEILTGASTLENRYFAWSVDKALETKLQQNQSVIAKIIASVNVLETDALKYIFRATNNLKSLSQNEYLTQESIAKLNDEKQKYHALMNVVQNWSKKEIQSEDVKNTLPKLIAEAAEIYKTIEQKSSSYQKYRSEGVNSINSISDQFNMIIGTNIENDTLVFSDINERGKWIKSLIHLYNALKPRRVDNGLQSDFQRLDETITKGMQTYVNMLSGYKKGETDQISTMEKEINGIRYSRSFWPKSRRIAKRQKTISECTIYLQIIELIEQEVLKNKILNVDYSPL